MTRFLAVVLAALACAFAYLVATGIALPAAATVRVMFVVSSVALLVSAAAMALALAATARARTQRIDVQNLARSVDAALADLIAGRKHGDSILEPATEAKNPVAEEKPISYPDEADRRPIEIVAAAPHIEPPRTAPAERARATNTAQTAPAFRLNPLLSVATGATAGYDVLANASLHGTAAVIEQGLVVGAIEASSQPGFASDRTPLHVRVSQALLADREQFVAVTEALRRLNGTARSIVLTLPTALMEQPAQHSAALAKLAATRSRLAAEGWPSSEAGIEALWRSGVSFLRLPAAKLLARRGADARHAATLIERLTAGGMAAIATGVDEDAEAAELTRLGIALMTDIATPDTARPRHGNGAGKDIHI